MDEVVANWNEKISLWIWTKWKEIFFDNLQKVNKCPTKLQAFVYWANEIRKAPTSLAIDFIDKLTQSDVTLLKNWKMAWIYLLLHCNCDFVSHLDNECRELLGAFSWGGRDFVKIIDNDDAVVWGGDDNNDNSGNNGRRWWQRIVFNLYNSYS